MANLGLEALTGDSGATLAQLAAINTELDRIAKQSPSILSLSQAFGISYDSASKLLKTLGLQANQIREAATTMRQLSAAGADSTTKFAILTKQLGLTVDQVDDLDKAIGDLQEEESVVDNLRNALGSLFVLDKINEFKSQILSVGLTFEKLFTQLKTGLGGQSAAEAAFKQIQVFAKTTPFQVGEVTDTFVKLQNRGIKPTEATLRRLGDIASSQGKGLNQVTEAILDAQQGEFERLKEFGIRGSVAGDKVNIAFKGINKTVERTPEAMTAAVLAIGDMQGVAGGMEEQSKTLGGQFSNLDDNAEALAGEFFKLAQGPMVQMVQQANALYDSFFALPAPVKGLVFGIGGLIGILGSAVIAITTFRALNIATSLEILKQSGILTVQKVSMLASVAGDYAKAASQAALALATKGTTSGLSEQTAQMAKTAVAGAALGAALIGAVAVGALVIDTVTSVSRSTAEQRKNFDAASNSLVAFAEANERLAKQKRPKTEKAEPTDDGGIQAAFNANIGKSIGVVQQFGDAVRGLLVAPLQEAGRALQLDKIFGFVSGLAAADEGFAAIARRVPALNAVASVLATITGKLSDALQGSGTASEAAANDAKIAFADVLTQSDQLSKSLATVKATPLADLDTNQLDQLSKAYEQNIAAIKATVPANADAKAAKDIYLQSLEKEQKDLAITAKLVEELAKRQNEVGTAQEQLAGQTKKFAEQQKKGLLSSEDAQKYLETLEKQRKLGAITADEYQQQVGNIAKDTKLSNDVQIAGQDALAGAVKESSEARVKSSEVEQARIQAAVKAGAKTQEQADVELTQIKLTETQARIAAIQAQLDAEIALGKGSGQNAKDLRKQLESAKAQEIGGQSDLVAKKEAQAFKTASDQIKTVQDKKLTDLEVAKLREETLVLQGVKTAEQAGIAQAQIAQQELATKQATLKQQLDLELTQRVKNKDKIADLQNQIKTGQAQQDKAAASARVAIEQEALSQIEKANKAAGDTIAKDRLASDINAKKRELALSSIDPESDEGKKAGDEEAKRVARERVASSEKEAAAAQASIDRINRARSQGLISEKVATEQLLNLNQQLGNAQLGVLDAKIAESKSLREELKKIFTEKIDESKEKQSDKKGDAERASAKRLAKQKYDDAQKALAQGPTDASADNTAADIEKAEQNINRARENAEEKIAIAEDEKNEILKRIEAINKAQAAGELSKKEANKQRKEANAEIETLDTDVTTQAAEATEAEVEGIQKIKDAKDSQAREAAAQSKQAADEAKGDYLERLQQQKSLASAALDLASGLFSLEQQRLQLSIEAKGADGDRTSELEKQKKLLASQERQARVALMLKKLQLEADKALAEAKEGGLTKTEKQIFELKEASLSVEGQALNENFTAKRDALDPKADPFKELRSKPREIDFSGLDKVLEKQATGTNTFANDLRTTGQLFEDGVSAFVNATKQSFGSAVGDKKVTPFGGFREKGGSVEAGTSYIVGEKGPELVTFPRNGFVFPNNMLTKDGKLPAVSAASELSSNAKVVAELQQVRALLKEQSGGGLGKAELNIYGSQQPAQDASLFYLEIARRRAN